MSLHMSFRCRFVFLFVLTVCVFGVGSLGSVGFSQLFMQRNVGGVVVDPDGVLQTQPHQLDHQLQQDLLEKLRLAPDELQDDTELRKVSLRGMQDAIKSAIASGESIPQEVQFLAGLHHIQYVLVYPEEADIVLAGPGGGWSMDEAGRVVGSHGKPVLQLDDFLIAMRTVFGTSDEMISCSINPTQEGLQRYQSLLTKQARFQPSVLPAIERALGPQVISVTGVPGSSHFAHVLVAADYRMKRIAMGLDPSPLKRLPSYMEMIPSARAVKNAMPRWWLACNYESLARSEDGLAWEVRGSGVKCLAESAFLEDGGEAGGKRRGVPAIGQWADRMTAQYVSLSEREPIFAELQQLMDFCVVAALIREKGLHVQAQCDVSVLTNESSGVTTYVGNVPRRVPSQASVVKRGRNYIISASGGVEIDAWSVVQQTELNGSVAAVRKDSAAPAKGSTWWWD